MSRALKLVLTPLLLAQAVHTRRRLPRLPEAEGPRAGDTADIGGTGNVGTTGNTSDTDDRDHGGAAGAFSARPLRLLVAGDSSAAGVGVTHQRDALAMQLAQRLARASGARVAWRLVARSGVTTAQTLRLLQQQPSAPPADVAVLLTGVNDLIDRVPLHAAVQARNDLADWLRNAHGVRHTVVAALPPVHQFPGLPQPLRWVAGNDARRHNQAAQRWAGSRGDVSFVDMQVQLHRGVMAVDGFHPAEPVYRHCADVLAAHIAGHVWPALRPV